MERLYPWGEARVLGDRQSLWFIQRIKLIRRLAWGEPCSFRSVHNTSGRANGFNGSIWIKCLTLFHHVTYSMDILHGLISLIWNAVSLEGFWDKDICFTWKKSFLSQMFCLSHCLFFFIMNRENIMYLVRYILMFLLKNSLA